MLPTKAVRELVYERDGRRCVACAATEPLSFQHRNNALRRERPLPAEGLTACTLCNVLFESTMQRKAWRFGWSVRRWVGAGLLVDVPVFYQRERQWALLLAGGERGLISSEEAVNRMLHLYGEQWRAWGVVEGIEE